MNYKKLLLVGTLLGYSTLLFGAEGGQGQAEVQGGAARAQEKTVKIKTSDAQEFEVPLSRANKMLLIKNMLSDLGEDDDASVPLPNVDGPTFELLISWLKRVGFANFPEDRARAYEELKRVLVQQLGEGNIQEHINLLVSLGLAADFLNLHIFEREDTYSAETMNIIAQVLVNLLIGHEQEILSGAVSMPEQLNALCAGNIFAECVMNLLGLRMPYKSRILEGHTRSVRCLAVLSGNLFVSGSWDGTVRVWNASTGECLLVLEGHTRQVSRLAVLSGNRIVSGSDDNTMRVWNASTGECQKVLSGHTNSVSSLAVLPDGFIVSGSVDRTVRVWDPSTGECLNVLQGHTGIVSSLTVLQDGSIVSSSWDKTVRVWNASTGECLHVLEGHTMWVYSVAVLPDGCIVSASDDKTVRIWDPLTGECLKILRGHTEKVYSLAVLSSNLFASYGSDRAVRVWNASTRQCLQILEGHDEPVYSCTVLQDGFIVSGSQDGTMRVWNASTGQCLQVLEGHADWVTSLAVLPDGSIVSGFGNGAVQIWSNLLMRHKDRLTIQQAVILFAILQSKALPPAGSSAHAVWMSISEAIRAEIRRDFDIRAYDDAAPAAEPAS